MPKFLGEITQSGGDFALIDSSNIRGGLFQVDTIEERDNIVADKLKNGTLALVTANGNLYEYKSNDGLWHPFNIQGFTSETIKALTPSQTVTEVKEDIINEDGSTYKAVIFDSLAFSDGDIIGWNLVANSNGTISGEFSEVVYVKDDIVYLDSSYESPPVDTEVFLCGSSSDTVKRCVLVQHTYKGATVLTQFLNISIDNIFTNYTFRLGQNEVNYWKLYAEDVHLKGTFIDDNNRNLSELATINQDAIETGLKAVRQEFGYENLLNNPNFISGLDCWITKNVATYFKLGTRWVMSNKTLLSTKKGGAYVITENGTILLRLVEGFISQKNENLKKILDYDSTINPYYVTLIFSYKAVSDGTLTISIENESDLGYDEGHDTTKFQQQVASTNNEYYTLKTSFLWNGTGDFKLNYTGELKIQALVVKLNEVKNLEKKYAELFNYSSTLIEMAKQYENG